MCIHVYIFVYAYMYIYQAQSIQNTSSRATEYTDFSFSDCKRARVCGKVRTREKERERGRVGERGIEHEGERGR